MVCPTPLPAPQYASWNGLASPDDFYASQTARQAYKDHVAFMVGRTNSVNGRVYRWVGGRAGGRVAA
jgi:endo-1,4-beta-mannosidase